MKFTVMLIALVLSCLSVCAQKSAADKYYAQGVTCMKTMTVPSQKKAIGFFEKAKVAYDSASKKALCDEQITACQNIIKKLSAAKPSGKKPSKPSKREEVTVMTDDSAGTAPIEPAFVFKASKDKVVLDAKGGEYEEVNIECSGDWAIDKCPEWVSCTKSSAKLYVKAEKNKKKQERADFIVLSCGNEKIEIAVIQSKSNKIVPFL